MLEIAKSIDSCSQEGTNRLLCHPVADDGDLHGLLRCHALCV